MHGDSGHTAHHIIPVRVLATVFGVLIALTVTTVITARIDLGALNVPLALAIAASKAALVVAVFMALRYDNRVNALVFFIGSIFVIVFLALTLSDTALRGALGMTDAGAMTEGGLSASTAAPGATPQAPESGAAAASDSIAAGTDSQAANGIAVPVVDGSAVYTQYLCNTCHSTDGTAGVGPTMQGIGAQQSREEIRNSILTPESIIAEGFAPGVMTATLTALRFFDSVSEDELEALVDYIVSL